VPQTEARALVFDVFGTVVDWRGSVIREAQALGRAKGFELDWGTFADTWREEGYHDGMERIRRGETPWVNVDTLHRQKLDELLQKYNVSGLSEAEIDHFSKVWHRLWPWPDSVPGLTRLRHRFVLSTLSNGSFALLTNMGKNAALPWDCIISAELFQKYKPDLEVYRSAAALLGLEPSEVMMVAAHVGDLKAARTAGLRTAFVSRPFERGRGRAHEPEPDPSRDVISTGFVDMAAKLGV